MTEAREALREALETVGMSSRPAPDDTGADLVVDVHGRTVIIQVKQQGTASYTALAELPTATSGWREEVPRLWAVVADRLLGSGREVLNERGWSWLDLRGHLRLVGPGLHVDTPVPAYRTRPARTRALSGSAGVEVACALLLAGQGDPSVRGLARDLGRSPSTVSEVLRALRSEGLLDEHGQVAKQELFWEVASVWRPPSASVAVVAEPGPGARAEAKALRLGLEDVEATEGWALTDTLAAIAHGAPVVAGADHPLDFYVPNGEVFRRARRLLPPRDGDGRTATIRIAPAPAVCRRRIDMSGRSNQGWPVAHPLFVALDLAQDVGRGREILAQWHPSGWRRVW